MRVGVVTDSACDLPADYVKQQDIEVLPINLRLGEEQLLDIKPIICAHPETTWTLLVGQAVNNVTISRTHKPQQQGARTQDAVAEMPRKPRQDRDVMLGRRRKTTVRRRGLENSLFLDGH